MDVSKVEFKRKMYLGPRLTVEQAPDGAASALVESGWHKSDPKRKGSDQKEHCTVDFKDETGKVFERKHVYKTVDLPHSEPDT
ncbi:hypothetical protein FBULB1_6909 [Fusarium bulbicola]|nr:hypothetical protein FBULB1_6909 [Fusarium bulbicola]